MIAEGEFSTIGRLGDFTLNRRTGLTVGWTSGPAADRAVTVGRMTALAVRAVMAGRRGGPRRTLRADRRLDGVTRYCGDCLGALRHAHEFGHRQADLLSLCLQFLGG